MATKKYDVCFAQRGKDEKVHWKQIGVVIQTEKGFSLRLEMVPTGWDGWATLFTPKPKGEVPADKAGDESDVPF